MNLSANSIQAVKNFYNIKTEDVLVIYDDKDLPVGKFKIKNNGSAAGHNGVKHIIQVLGEKNWMRIKVGIGYNNKYPIKEWVLKNFAKKDLSLLISDILPKVQLVVNDFIDGNNYLELTNKHSGNASV